MLRRQVTISGNRFLCDFYSHTKDNVNRYSKFSFLRKIKVQNNIIYDTDIYVIENSILDIVLSDEYSETLHNSITEIVFPIVKNANSADLTETSTLYSDNFSNYNNISYSISKNIYKLYNYKYGNLVEADIACDLIKVWHPDAQTLTNSIVHVTALYNNIHFHFFCKHAEKIDLKVADAQFVKNNKTYLEYQEIYIPNIESLFKLENNYIYNIDGNNTLQTIRSTDNVYFIEDMNIISDKDDYDNKRLLNIQKSKEKGENIFENVNIPVDELIIDNKHLLPFNTLLLPFYIDTVDAETALKKYGVNYQTNVKRFTNNIKTIDNNYLTSPINLKFYLATSKTVDNYYMPLGAGNVSVVTFSEAYRFTLQASLGFDNGICSIITRFNYPNKDKLVNLYKDETIALQTAYKTYNNIVESNYNTKLYIQCTDAMDMFNLLSSNLPIYMQVAEEYESNGNTLTSYAYVKLKYKKKKNILTRKYDYWVIDDEEKELMKLNINKYFNYYKHEIINTEEETYDSDVVINDTSISSIGYVLQLSSEKNFSNIIYKRNAHLDFIEDAAFNLNNIFYSWNNMPDVIIAKVIFVDRVIGRAISSNSLVITKEWYKYLINDMDDKYRINLTGMKINALECSNAYDKNTKYYDVENKEYLPTQNNLAENMDLSYINFIDKINCIITKSDTEEKITSSINTNSSKMIYKPVFYRTYELQSIRLHNGITQNIGINLGEYLTKVDTFKLLIDGTMYTETARNDIYVIFNINAAVLTLDAGVYTILTSEGEYISDGNWAVY